MGSVVTHTIVIETQKQGLYEITDQVFAFVHQHAATDGLLTLFIMHTSASLIVQENADPSAKHDLEQWLNRLVPEHDPHFTHTLEGPDDMPAHSKAALTSTSISIPVAQGRLCLGTWQGIYVWEHRRAKHKRKVAASLISA
jgi:secondary thiamine-phosphate synthase enzyme